MSCLVALAAGCAQGSSAEDTSPPPAVALAEPGSASVPETSPADRPRTTPRRDLVGSGVAKAPETSACRKNAFCEDFEEPNPLVRWSSVTSTLGAIDFASPSSSLGAKSLHAATTGPGAAAYLSLAGPPVGQVWVGSLGFSMRVDATPATVMGGPEITVVDAKGAATRVGFSVRPDGIALHQYFESCSGPACTVRSDVVTDVKPGEWRRLTVGIETSGNAAPPYGRIEVTVDGGDLIVLPLTVTPFDGHAEMHAGITVADSVPSTAHVDDLVFFTH